ncbi:MAG: hypothetical protein ABIS01_15760, partial [Ferruginibacter sp.]
MPKTILLKNESILIKINSSDPGTVQILFEGQLVIKNAAAIKSGLLTALNSDQNLALVLKNIVKLDLAVLQLLIALQKRASRLDKKIIFDIESTDYVTSVIHNAG